MTKKDLKEMDRLLALKKYPSGESEKLTEFIVKYIDPNCKRICSKCPSQMRFAQNRIKSWSEKPSNKILIENLRDESK